MSKTDVIELLQNQDVMKLLGLLNFQVHRCDEAGDLHLMAAFQNQEDADHYMADRSKLYGGVYEMTTSNTILLAMKERSV